MCKYCGKSFSQRAVLRKHLVVHTGEQLNCVTCGIGFTQRSSLLRHVKRMNSSAVQINNDKNGSIAQVISDPDILSMDINEIDDIKPDIEEYNFDDDIEEVVINEADELCN